MESELRKQDDEGCLVAGLLWRLENDFQLNRCVRRLISSLTRSNYEPARRFQVSIRRFGAEAASEKNLQHETLFELHECALSGMCCQQTPLQNPTGSEQLLYLGM